MSVNKKSKSMVFIACGLALLALSPVAGLDLSMVVLSVFLLSISVPQEKWTVYKKLFVIALISPLLWIMSGDVSREMVTAILMVVVSMKSTERSRPRDISVLAVLNLFSVLIAMLQEPIPLVFVMSTFSVILSLISLDLSSSSHGKNVKAKSSYWFFIKTSLISIPAMFILYFLAAPQGWMVGNLSSYRQTTGFSDGMSISNWGSVLKDPSTAFRINFVGEPPPASILYFKGSVLDQFDGKKWLKGTSVVRDIPDRKSMIVKASAELESSHHQNVFMLGYPLSLPQDIVNGGDGSYLLPKRPEKGQMVSFSTSLKSVKRDIGSSELELNTELPDGFAIKTRELAKTIKASSRDDKDFINKTLSLFSKNYEYSLDIEKPKDGFDIVDNFMFNSKSGFCVHYSSSFVIMARSVGIPARVVTGYVSYDYSGSSYIRVKKSDAHAWVEVWQDGGWVVLDPTSVVPDSRVNDGVLWEVMSMFSDLSDKFRSAWNSFFLYDSKKRDQLIYEISNTINSNIFYLVLFAFVVFLINLRAKIKKRKTADSILNLTKFLNKISPETSSQPLAKRISDITSGDKEAMNHYKNILSSVFSNSNNYKLSMISMKSLKKILETKNKNIK